MTVLCFYPSDTTPNMYDDADEFRNRAQEFAKHNGGRAIEFPSRIPMPQRKAFVLRKLKAAKTTGVTAIGFFCHGWTTSGTGAAMQAGFRLADVQDLANGLSRFTALRKVFLFCCFLAAGKNNGGRSFVTRLRDAAHLEVWGHATKGHCNDNPYLIVAEAGINGPYYTVPPTSPRWKYWKSSLRDNNLWLDFPNTNPWRVMD